MSLDTTDPLSPGTHTFEVDGLVQSYHVHGTGPVCIAHSGGPGVHWEYLRMPEVERHLTVVYPEPIGTGGSGRLPSHPHGYTRELYSRFLDALVEHLGVSRVHLLGHSHGGFVVQYHALYRPERVAGVVLYDSAPVTGPELGAELMRQLEAFGARNAHRPDLPEVMGALQSVPSLSGDAEMTAALRGLIPSYFADYWGREEEFAPMRATVSGTHISGLDADLVPDLVDDREPLAALAVPTLVVVGRYDVICGLRWGTELHELIPGSQLLVLENSGHFGHIEEPERFAQAVVGFVSARDQAATA
ncbi:alpha/beta hydrolase [Streptomyces sp. ME01-24h]|nr:alpha/beta hydrolase [Streptomyces sp. ME19-03-3]MDX3355469.1 alpha/beta hydrolase [Streptomyces sp. ME01-24h]